MKGKELLYKVKVGESSFEEEGWTLKLQDSFFHSMHIFLIKSLFARVLFIEESKLILTHITAIACKSNDWFLYQMQYWTEIGETHPFPYPH